MNKMLFVGTHPIGDKKYKIFKNSKGETLRTSKCEEGIVKIEPDDEVEFLSFTKLISDCMDKKSGFFSEVQKAYELDTEVIGIEFTYRKNDQLKARA